MPLEGQVICTAHKRKTGEPCLNIAVRGKTVCRFHGGLSLSGAANGNYRHGRYSKDLPTRIGQRAADALTNPRLLSLTDELAVCEAREAELMAQLETGESGACWQALRETMTAFSAALASGDLAAMEQHFQAMRRLVDRGSAGVGVWEEIRRVQETRAKLVKTETDTMLKLQQMLTVQQALLIQAAQTEAIVQAVQKHADPHTGRQILMDVQAEFSRLATLEER